MDEGLSDVLNAHVIITQAQEVRASEIEDALEQACDTQQWLLERHVGYVQALGLAVGGITGSADIDPEDPIGVALLLVQRHQNVEAYARSCYDALGVAENALQQAVLYLDGGHDGTGPALQAVARKAQEECIGVLQAAEKF